MSHNDYDLLPGTRPDLDREASALAACTGARSVTVREVYGPVGAGELIDAGEHLSYAATLPERAPAAGPYVEDLRNGLSTLRSMAADADVVIDDHDQRDADAALDVLENFLDACL